MLPCLRLPQRRFRQVGGRLTVDVVQQIDPGIAHAAEFRRCLLELDVAGIRRLWRHVSPHLHQPATAEEALHTVHLARLQLRGLPARARRYSEDWLFSNKARAKISHAVGIAVSAPAHRATQAHAIRHAMTEAVTLAIRDGVDIDKEAGEVRERMMRARARA